MFGTVKVGESTYPRQVCLFPLTIIHLVDGARDGRVEITHSTICHARPKLYLRLSQDDCSVVMDSASELSSILVFICGLKSLFGRRCRAPPIRLKGHTATNLLEVVIMYLVEEPSVSDHWDLPLMQDFLEQWLGQSNLVSLAYWQIACIKR